MVLPRCYRSCRSTGGWLPTYLSSSSSLEWWSVYWYGGKKVRWKVPTSSFHSSGASFRSWGTHISFGSNSESGVLWKESHGTTYLDSSHFLLPTQRYQNSSFPISETVGFSSGCIITARSWLEIIILHSNLGRSSKCYASHFFHYSLEELLECIYLFKRK